MAWALWVDEDNRAAKMHVHFEVLRGIPVKVTVTEGNGSETFQLRSTLTADRLYVVEDYQRPGVRSRWVCATLSNRHASRVAESSWLPCLVWRTQDHSTSNAYI